MFPAPNKIHPQPKIGKRIETNLYQSLPYDAERAALDCGHNTFYSIRFLAEQPMLCGLCFFREGVEAEVPNRIHQFKTLAANGNPETTPKMVSHLHVVMGLKGPNSGESLTAYRKRRISPTREQYTARSPLEGHKLFQLTRSERFSSAAPGLFPVTSALWRLMGYQPPLGLVLVEGVYGRTEREIAYKFDVSVLNIYVRMAKAIRIGVGFIPDGGKGSSTSSRRRGTRRSEETGSDEQGTGDPESEG
jgi:hypothetical protein